jgi:hypothetical protein
MVEPFDGSCFDHSLSKRCQYATCDGKVCCKLHYASIKSTQINIHKCITWLKVYGKVKQTWEKAHVKLGLNLCKLNTLVNMRCIFKIRTLGFYALWLEI